MRCWQIDQLRLVSRATTSEQAFANILPEVTRLGFAYASFGMKAPVPLVAPRVVWCSNYPREWASAYENRQYIHCDPTVAHAIVSDNLVVWTDTLFAACPDMKAEAVRHGLVHGLAQPRRDAQGLVSLLTLAREAPPITDEELKAKLERIQWLSYLCHEGTVQHWAPSLFGAPDNTLSERELDVLRWSSDGHTASEMAQILGVTEATVNFHIRNACQKLGTRNKTSATVRAALMGLLF
jgi:LuxR family transcriptional regulator, quorum-sensing system regulator SolR